MRRETATGVMMAMRENQEARRNEMATSGFNNPWGEETYRQLLEERARTLGILSSPFSFPAAITPKKVDKPEAKGTQVKVDDEYLALSESVGVDSPIVANELLKRCLKAERIFIYNTEHVEKYLKSMFTKSNQRLVWKPLRAKDSDTTTYSFSTGSSTKNETGIYNRAIPGHALQKADTLIQAFDRPDDLCFEVSDYEDVRPDPFLSVRIKNSDSRFVIAYWDEPNFRMEE